MKKKVFYLVLVTAIMAGCAGQTGEDYSSSVNPFIGTVGNGNTFLGPVMPYGMVQLGPYQRYPRGDFEKGTIYGFSHTHVSGMAGGGNAAAGDVIFMPVIIDKDTVQTFSSAFRHDNEQAEPGYYSVLLDDSGIRAELTATTRTGLHRYTFPEAGHGAVMLKINNGDLKVDGEEISGVNNHKVYFVARFSTPFTGYEVLSNDRKITGSSASGNELKAIFRFDHASKQPLLLKVGISMVSEEGARKNLEQELPGWNFDLIRSKAREAWNKELGKIHVEGGTEKERTIFYTSLYHALIHPNIYMDVDGKYRSTDGKVYTAKGFENYTNFSLWDTFRAVHPLYTIINQKRTNDFINTFLERYDHTGRMLIMEFNGVEGETPPMIAYHSLSVLADAYVKGIRGYDVKKAYEAMKGLANDLDREGKELYLEYGFIPSDLKGQSVSRTLEYSYDDWCVTRLAQDFSDDDLLYYQMRGDFYKNLFDTTVNFMRGRRSNFRFVPGFDPMETINHYTEANAYQYSTFVPQDIEGLRALMGGDKALEKWLDACFTTETDFSKINVRDVTGLIGQYAHGNEPSHHIAYLYNYAGTPWKTQAMVRRIMNDLYDDTQNGIDGNEDCGQMSAWYVMSAMGIYAVTPGMDYYVIGSPLFDRAVINLENGNQFEIIAENNGEGNVYIQSATLNGKPYTKSYLKHADIMAGGKFIFEMGPEPNREWGAKKEDRPYSAKKKFEYAALPQFDFPDILFLNSTTVKMAPGEPGAKIYYTLDGTEPTENATLYTSPVVIDKPLALKVRSYAAGKYPGYPITVHFRQIPMLEAVQITNLKPGVRYIYREGNIRGAKYLDDVPILDRGVLKTFNVDAIKDERPFGYNLYGYLKVPATGVYHMALEANDGAVLYINDQLIIDNDGGHRSQRLDTKIGLKKGWHPIRVDYFQQGLAKNLIVTWEGPGVPEQEIPAAALFHKEE